MLLSPRRSTPSRRLSLTPNDLYLGDDGEEELPQLAAPTPELSLLSLEAPAAFRCAPSLSSVAFNSSPRIWDSPPSESERRSAVLRNEALRQAGRAAASRLSGGHGGSHGGSHGGTYGPPDALSTLRDELVAEVVQSNQAVRDLATAEREALAQGFGPPYTKETARRTPTQHPPNPRAEEGAGDCRGSPACGSR